MSSPDLPSTPEGGDELVARVFERFADLDGDDLRESLSDTAAQRLLTLAIKTYASKLEEERLVFPFVDDDSLTPTEVGVTVGCLIKAADIDLFELVAWQSLMDG